MIKIYNTLTKKKEQIERTNIKIYTCGVTVYDNCHIGHARVFLLFDSLIRYLKSENKNITLIRNITDIDDKIIKKSKEKNIPIKIITKKFIKIMRIETKRLNLIEPTFEPKATFFIKEMINLIKKIKNKNHTYKNKNSSIYFKTNSINDYGILSKQTLNNLKNIKYIKDKKQLTDFVLWKNFNKNENIFWNTEWGIGRPGWHTECAAMLTYYNDIIDIHGGGLDLLFPHHENEIALCKAAYNKNIVKIWMHIGQIKINKKKMSKSLNNYILIKDFLKKFNEECLRLLILSSNYKKSIEYKLNNIKKMQITLEKLYKIKNNIKQEYTLDKNIEKLFKEAIDDNFNTQKAISILFKSLNEKNKKENIDYTVVKLMQKIGLLKHNNIRIEKKIPNIEKILEQRYIARKNKNWILADKLRQKLIKMNIKVQDKKID